MKERMLTEAPFGQENEPVHLDGYNFMPYFRGDTGRSVRVRNSFTLTTVVIF